MKKIIFIFCYFIAAISAVRATARRAQQNTQIGYYQVILSVLNKKIPHFAKEMEDFFYLQKKILT